MIRKFNGDVKLAVEDKKEYLELCRSLNLYLKVILVQEGYFNLH